MKQLILVIMLAFIGLSTAYAQVGIGTTAPDASAILDLTSTTQGLLPPRMTAAQRDNDIDNPAQGLMIYCTNCGANGEAQLYNGAAWVNVVGGVAAAAPGDFRDGGVVFYVASTPIDLNGDGTLNIGLIAAVSDQSSGTQWGCHNTAHLSTLTGIGQGAQNTNAINAGCATSGIAADICANLDLNGYTDWFLPSKDELNLMYQNLGPGNALELGNIGSFAEAWYWSSTDISSIRAWLQNFITGFFLDSSKNYAGRVRAVRAF